MDYSHCLAVTLVLCLGAFACGSSDDNPSGSGGTGNYGGSGSGTGTCSATSAAPAAVRGSCTTSMLCQEFTGSSWDAATQKSLCDAISGTLGTGPCSRAKATSACQYQCGGASEFVQIDYTGTATQAMCEADKKGKWITP